jgi:pimeloyl-ACP methyl ester carboxylesterase
MTMARPAATLLLVCAVALAGCSTSGRPSPSSSQPRTLSGTVGKAAYAIEVPAHWNVTLFLYSHGYVTPGQANGAVDAPGPDVASWLLGQGYAVAGSSYSSTGWAVEDALKDQVALLDFFAARVGKPRRTIAWGHSLGGIITAGLVQLYPDRFAGAIPMCGVLAGSVATWNQALDGAYAFKTLLAPDANLQLVHISQPAANLQLAGQLAASAGSSPAGQARLALAAALGDLPGWFDPAAPEPAPDDYAARAAAQALWNTHVDFGYAFAARAEVEQRAGGNPSWNLGVDYRQLLQQSIDREEVAGLYRAAGLDLDRDLAALNAGATIKPDAAAVAYLRRNIVFDGRLPVPVLTLHTAGDGLVVPEQEDAYAAAVKAAGSMSLLRQVFVHRAGHCAFTEAETIAAAQILVQRLDRGSWDDAALDPAALNRRAVGLGSRYAAAFTGAAAAPAFYHWPAAPFLRPFDANAQAPAA